MFFQCVLLGDLLGSIEGLANQAHQPAPSMAWQPLLEIHLFGFDMLLLLQCLCVVGNALLLGMMAGQVAFPLNPHTLPASITHAALTVIDSVTTAACVRACRKQAKRG